MRIAVTLIISLLIVVSGKVVFNRKSHKQELTGKIQLMELLTQLNERWRLGDIENKYKKNLLECSHIPNELDIDPNYFECNPLYFDCYLKEQIRNKRLYFLYKNSKINYIFKQSRTNELYDYLSPTKDGYEVRIVLGTKEYPLEFQKNCHRVYLPQRKYSYGPKEVKKDTKIGMTWDNFRRHYFLDKFLVSNYEVAEWLGDSQRFPKKEYHLPNTSLKPFQMQKYCSSKGKKIMKAHLFDAASFLPPDEMKTQPIIVQKNPYPWTRKNSLKKNVDNYVYEEGVKADSICEELVSSECISKGYRFNPYNDGAVTWMGIYYALGGYMEYLVNDIDRDLNLKLSSFYYPANHPVHKIGIRGSLNENNEIDFYDYSLVEDAEPEIGFRCYKETL
jgi:hypothetical protein